MVHTSDGDTEFNDMDVGVLLYEFCHMSLYSVKIMYFEHPYIY